MGVPLVQIDTFQYHPSGGVYPEQLVGALVTEGIRSEGGHLVNAKGERFVNELDTRDVVSSSIIKECEEGRGVRTPAGRLGVWLDTPLLDVEHGTGTLDKHFPAMVRQYERYQVDIRKDPVLIYPTLHYQNGGVKIDVKGETPAHNLFVAGEASGGLHGRNRLMGNSLLDLMVFGKRAGQTAAERAKSSQTSSCVIRADLTHGVASLYATSLEVNISLLCKEGLKEVETSILAKLSKTQRTIMNIHEFQAKQLFAQFGIPVPKGKEIKNARAAEKWAAALETSVYVVKAQIHAGGRGKAGGVKLTKNREEVPGLAQELIGKTLVTHQTGPKGRKVRRLLIEEGAGIEKELYLSLLVDRDSGFPTFIASTEGGMEIEEVAEHTPEKVLKESIDPAVGFQGYNGRNLAFGLGLPDLEPAVVKPFQQMLDNLYRLFMEKNASLVEINPLVITTDKRLIALDGKVSFDDNSLYKHPDVQKFRDLHEEEPLEIEAGKNNLNYVKLDGDIGCMVNGAGLAMATMDVIKLAGSEPANFLDVGGGATKETVAAGFRILLKDKKVKGVFINIFGGIVRCERIAHGVIDAAKEVGIKLPVVVRLQGTNAEEGRKLLAESGLKVEGVADLWEAAQRIVALRKKKK
jgi:succinyl-CoA synthetase beta subunit